MINDLLEKIGLSNKEILLYLTLIQRGRLTVSQLATTAQLKRTTIYGVLSTLLKKNLIVEELASPTAVYLPAPVASLIAIFEKKETELHKQKELAIRAASEISRMSINQPFQFAKISFISEPDIETHMVNNTQRWLATLQGNERVWRGFQDSRLLQQFPKYFSSLYSKMLPSYISQEIITEDMPAELEFENRNYPQRHIRIWKHGYDFTYSTWVIGSYVIMIQAKDQPYYLIEMKDPALAKNLSDLFAGIWTHIKTDLEV